MNKYKVLSLITVVLGITMVVYGGYDDSPGAQLLGLILIIVTAFILLKKKKKTLIFL